MPLTTGTRLGAYEIVAPLGAGGMGEVYRAHDTKLRRDVALKILPPHLSNDPDRRARFTREAHVLASLNHPNIAHIYGLEGQEGRDGQEGKTLALVMELVDGETLADRITRGPIPVSEALVLARQIVDALDAAHESGIVHRDLKPANIKVSEQGRVKVLDFGLAKALEASTGKDAGPLAELSHSPTMTSPAMTQMGMILGTAAYMSPEQAKGKPVDKRTDIWAFGCVLYEMLTGARAFDGHDITDFIVSVMTKEPDWTRLPASTPPGIVELLKRCVKKDPRERLRDIADARIEMGSPHLINAIAPTPLIPATRRSLSLWRAAAVSLAAAVLVLAALYLRQPVTPQPLLTRLQLRPPDKSTLGAIALSPDGRRLAFTATDASGHSQLWIRAVESIVAQPLPDTDGATYPFWSPDSRLIGFFTDGNVKKIDPSSGRPQTLCSFPAGRGGARGGTWNRAGLILFAYDAWSPAPLYQVPAAGGEARPATSLDASRHEEQHFWPAFLPDGRHFLYFVASTQGEQTAHTAVYLGSLDGQASERLFVSEASAVYASHAGTGATEDYILYVRERTLMAQPFDPRRLHTVGEAIPVDEPVGVDLSAGYRSQISASETGTLVHAQGSGISQLFWFDRAGKQLQALGSPGLNIDFRISPDGQRVAVQREDGLGGSDIWLLDAARAVTSRFTSHPAYEAAPVWSRDGGRIAFFSTRNGPWSIYEKASTESGDERLLSKSSDNLVPDDWSPDGGFLLYQDIAAVAPNGPNRSDDLWLLPTRGTAAAPTKPTPFLQTEFAEYWGRFSPDGRWIAYQSNETGRLEIYVRPFRSEGTSAGKWPMSTNGGVEARWSRSGNELYYLAPDNMLVAVDIHSSATTIQVGAPRALFQTRAVGINRYDVASDGRFLINVPAENTVTPVTVVLNWQEELHRRTASTR